MTEQNPAYDVRIMLRPLGSGLPLGFLAFGTGMAVLGGLGVGVIPSAMLHQAGVLLITFVAPLELLAAVLAFLARDGLAGTGLAFFGGSWVTLGVQFLLQAPGGRSSTLALYVITFSVAVALLAVAARTGQPLLAGILLLSSVRGLLSGAYEITGVAAVQTAAGVAAFVITVLAFYGGLAFVLEDTAHRTVLPLGRRGQSRTSLEGGMADQLAMLESEAGVRRSL